MDNCLVEKERVMLTIINLELDIRFYMLELLYVLNLNKLFTVFLLTFKTTAKATSNVITVIVVFR